MKKIIATTVLLFCIIVAPSEARYVLGVADRTNPTTETIEAAQALGGRTYRVLIDPSQSLSVYEATIKSIRDGGMRPQLMVGGIGTGRDYSMKRAADVAALAYKRWPDAFSVSFMNEPDLYNVDRCEYRRLFRKMYKKLHALGARVLIGELSPYGTGKWMRALNECGPITADGFAWHPYDNYPSGMVNTKSTIASLRKLKIRTPRGFRLPLYATEYGVKVDVSDDERLWRWKRALRIASEYNFYQLVVYQLEGPSPAASHWDTSIVGPDGPSNVFNFLKEARGAN